MLGDVGGGHGDDAVEGDDDGGLVVDACHTAMDAFEDALGDEHWLVLDEVDFGDIDSVDLVGVEFGKTDEVDHLGVGNGHADVHAEVVVCGAIIDEVQVGKAVGCLGGVDEELDVFEGGKHEDVAVEHGLAHCLTLRIRAGDLHCLVGDVGEDAMAGELLLGMEALAECCVHEEPLEPFVRGIFWRQDVLHWLPQS